MTDQTGAAAHLDRLRLLLTGGAGFIGSHLAETYVSHGHLVKVLDDFSSGNVNNIRGLFNHKNFKLIRGDVRDKPLLQRVTQDVDVILHLAAQVNVDSSIVSPRTTFEVNTLGTLNILDVALENDVKQVVYASSSEVYGTAQYVPMDENHPLNPGSPYAASKVAADRLCFSYYNTYKMNVTVIRNFNTFGPRQKSTGYGAAIPIFIRRVLQGAPPIIYGDGRQTRDYMYIDDAVDAYDLLLNAGDKLAGRAVNFGTGKEISILELANVIIKLCGAKVEPVHVAPRPGEVRRLYAGTKLAESELGFKPRYDLPKGLSDFIEWYRKGKYEEWLAYTREEA